jgi:hypothetical protein
MVLATQHQSAALRGALRMETVLRDLEFVVSIFVVLINDIIIQFLLTRCDIYQQLWCNNNRKHKLYQKSWVNRATRTEKINTIIVLHFSYPSAYTPTGTGTCSFTINKCCSDVCQLRLDFETMSGFVTATAPVGGCTDSFAVACKKLNQSLRKTLF